ncbi:MAG: GH3 auxin-responsive promoter family protein [Blastocatellia bacterium]
MIRPSLKLMLRHSYARFKKQLDDPRGVQQSLLKVLIANLATTEYGRSLGVKAGDDYEAFSRKAPVAGYDQISRWVEKQKASEGKVLVSEPVLFYEKSSGSSGPQKYIPYTRALKASFNRMFSIWLYDLLEHGPRFETAKTFISISPAFREAQEVKVGLDDDSDYLSTGMRLLLKRFFVAPASIKKLSDPVDFKRVLSALLVAEPELEIISIWNASLFEVILDYIQTHSDELISDLNSGFITCAGVTFKFKQSRGRRAAVLKEQHIDWARVWPKLKLISCWTSAGARSSALRITDKFPGVSVQGKGLLATEAPMTMPLIEARGFVPLAGEVFYEFLDGRGNISLLHELEAGREYEIVVTQKSGLFRYQIGDRIRVTHFYKATPCMEFTGRSDAVSDLVGEKLNETFAQNCLLKLPIGSGSFQTLLPVMLDRACCHYVLLIDELPDGVRALEAQLDEILCTAYHYRTARKLGQLDAAKVLVVPRARDAYYDYFISRGMKWGDIKHQYLIKNTEDAKSLLSRLDRSTASPGAVES